MPLKKNENQTLTNFQNSHKKYASWLTQQAVLHPERPAFFYEEQVHTFSELQQMVQSYAYDYQRKLPKDSTIVAVYGKSSPAFIYTVLALWELGVTVQFLNMRLTESECRIQLLDSQAQALIVTDQKLAVTFAPCVLIQAPKTQELQPLKKEDWFDLGYQTNQVASIMYTSGTTGKAKGVRQTFGNHQASAIATKKSLSLTADDCWLNVMPLYHISGLSIFLRSLVIGLSVRLLPKYAAEQVHHWLQTGQVSVVSVVTKMLQDLLSLTKESYPASLKGILLGGGPVRAEVLEKCIAYQLPVMQSYGMTETCSQIFALPFAYSLTKLGSAGLALQDVQCKIEPLNEKETIGEILVKGPSITPGYLHGLAKERFDKEGYFHTGDLGYLDEDGFLFVKSRLGELIISGGENIYPKEIEDCLSQHPQIQEVAVVGEANEKWGHVPVAYLKLATDDFDKSQLNQLLVTLAKYKRPQTFYVLYDFPKTASGKIQKYQLSQIERVKVFDANFQ